jgi:hypothetical protein
MDMALAHRAQVIRVDLLADDLVAAAVDHHRAADAAERLGECDGGAAVQDAIRLHRAMIDGHPGGQAIRLDRNDLDVQLRAHRAAPQLADFVDAELPEPDTHGR